MTTTFDRVLAFMLERALKQLPPGTRIKVEDYEIRMWIDRKDTDCSLRIDKREEPGYLGKAYAAFLVNDPRATTVKRQFDFNA